MYIVRILKDGQQTNEGRFTTEQEAMQWISKGNQNGWWQTEDKTEVIPERKEIREIEIQPEIQDENGNVIQERIVEQQEVIVQEAQTIIHPAIHTYEIVDGTAQINYELALQKRAKLRLAGERLIDEMSIRNAELGVSGTQLKAIMTDEDAVYVRELLWTGSLQTAKAYILEKQAKFESLVGAEYVSWLLNKIDAAIAAS